MEDERVSEDRRSERRRNTKVERAEKPGGRGRDERMMRQCHASN